MNNDDLIRCHGVLALECIPDASPDRLVLDRDESEHLAGLLGADLAGLLPDLAGTRLAVAGALFDAAQLLRPGFPAYTTLDELASRLPRERGGIVAFGAHEGRMPVQPLTPDPSLAGSPMLYLPWILQAAPEQGQALGEAMETELIGRGEAGTQTADYLMRTLGVRLEHARYLSRHDLMAMTCVQYEHAGLAPLWTVLEAALLDPHGTESTVSARGLPLRYEAGAVHVASPLAQLRSVDLESPDEAAHTLAGWIFELRQYAAVLAAHQLPLRIDGNATDHEGLFLEPVAETDPILPTPALFTHPAPGLGTVAISIAQTDGPHVHPIAHALVLAGRLDTHLARLADRYGTVPTPQPLERLCMDKSFSLTVPAQSPLH
jgi:hypothetical protein